MTRATFIDANVLIRHLAGDHPAHSPAAKQLIADLENGRLAGWTTDLTISEVVWVLTSRSLYGMSRNLVQDTLLPIIELPSLHLDGKRLYRRIFEIYVNTNVDFIDAVHAARIEPLDPPHLFSFDRDFDRIPGVFRIEPTTKQ